MLIAMEPQALELGILATDYWNMTFQEIMVQCQAYKAIKEREIKEKASFDYNLVQGMMYAFNDPKNMPKADKLYPMLAEEPKEIEKPKDIQPFDVDANQALFMQLAEGVKRYNQEHK